MKLSYTLEHTQLFLDQAHNNTISGFVPNSNSADPNWGKCLQCGAIDRARYKTNPVTPRSEFCTTCFQQYCYNATNPPSRTELPNRNLTYFDPGNTATVVSNPESGNATASSSGGQSDAAIGSASFSSAVMLGALVLGLGSTL